MNAQGEIIKCSEPDFSLMTCFDPENLAELKTAIDNVNNPRLRKKLQKSFNRAFIR